jgi:hypothetical protein
MKIGCAIRVPAEGNAVGLGLEADDVNNPRPVWSKEIDGFPSGVECEAQLILVERDKSHGGNAAARDDELVGGRIIGQNAASQIHRRRAVVEEFDEIQIGKIGVRENLVDEHRLLGV